MAKRSGKQNTPASIREELPENASEPAGTDAERETFRQELIKGARALRGLEIRRID